MTRTTPPLSPDPPPPNRRPRGVLRRWRAARRARLTVERLEALPDHLLADIGLTRGSIGPAVRRGRPRG